jgi:hypothetical protein
MSGIRSRSAASTNLVEFRHPSFFEEYEDWHQQTADHAAYLEAQRIWKEKPEATRGPAPVVVPPPDLAQYKDTPLDSVWRFRRHKANGDAEQILWMVSTSSIDWQDMAKQYAESNGRVVPHVTERVRVTTQRAELAQMTVDVEGPFFRIPEDFTIGDFEGTTNEHPHPLAGQMMPIEPSWLNALDESVLDAASAFLRETYARRTPDQQAAFQAERVSAPAANRSARRRGARGAQ